MKILLLAQGQATHTQRFIKLLLDAGHSVVEVDPFNPFPNGSERYEFIPYPVRGWMKRIRPHRLHLFLKAVASTIGLWLIWQKVRPDVVHALSIGDSAYRCAVAGIKPLVLTAWGSDINNMFPLTDGALSDYQKSIARALAFADYVTGDTQLLLDRCEILAGKKLNVGLFYFGVNLDLFKKESDKNSLEMRKSLGIPDDAKVVLSMRKFSIHMKQHDILKAFASAVHKRNVNAVLVFRRIFIRSDKYKDEVKDLAAQLGVLDRIYWADQMDYDLLPSLYHLADVVVNFPEKDGFPVTLFEAAASRTPVITSDLPDYREILDNGHFFRIPSGDVSSLAVSLGQVLANEIQDLNDRLQANYELVTRIASQEKSLADIEKIYRFAMKNHY